MDSKLMDKDVAWSVVMTKPRQENYAAARLAEQDFSTYLPMVAKRDKLGRKTGIMPMFPGYCFCGYAADQSIAPIRSTPGVISLVRFGLEIAVIQPAVVDRVRRVEAALQASADAGELKPGDKVQVIDGPFAGLEGLASRVSAERIDVLMTIMGQAQRIRFAPDHLARPG
jgi:transcriptional antiterminator RfaH